MKVVVNQSNYIPWKGYFDLIHDADLFVFYDDLQFTKNDWRNRNRLKTAAGAAWLSIPVGKDNGRLICEVELPADDWAQQHWRRIEENYRAAPYFGAFAPALREILLDRKWTRLSDLNQHLIRHIAREILGIATRFADSREYALQGRKQERLLSLLKAVGATTYISGPAAKAYLDEGRLREEGIAVVWKDYSGYPEYPQAHPPFEHAVSILDLIFHTGPRGSRPHLGLADDRLPAVMNTFSIVVPVYQNEANLPTTVPALLALQEKLPGMALELVLVDDGSRDRSRELAIALARAHPARIKVVLLTRNFGQTAAIQAGLRHATGACVGIISCDLQEPHELFVEMVRAWERGEKFVIGERVARAEDQGHRMVSSIYWRLIRRFAFPEFPPLGYDFCLLDRQVVEDINRIDEKNSSIFVLIYWLGYRPCALPVRRELRHQGRSQWRFWKKISFTADTLIGFTRVPSRLITFAGLCSALLCIVYLGVIIGQKLIYGQAPAGWATTVGLQLLLGAMILFALGIISEYLLRILDEARRRPPYVVERVIAPPRP